MKCSLCFPFLLLVMATVAVAQPVRAPAILHSAMVTGSLNADFGYATEQTSGPVVCDVTGDGLPEVIVTGRAKIWVLNYAHQDPQNPLFYWPAQDGYEFCGPVTVCRPSSSGNPWIVVGASKQVRYLGRLGTNDPCPHQNDDGPNSHLSGDCYHWHSIIEAWEITGSTATPHPSGDLADQRLTTPTAADANGDGKDELCFVGSQSYGISVWSGIAGHWLMRSCVGVRFYEFVNNAWTERSVTPTEENPYPQQTYWVAPAELAQEAQTVLAAGDVDGDGLPQFVTQSLWHAQAFSFSGVTVTENWHQDLGNFPPMTVDVLPGYSGEGPDAATRPWNYAAWDLTRAPGPVLADVDGQGHLSVFVQTAANWTGYIWKLNGADGSYNNVNYTYAEDEVTNGTELAIGDDQSNGRPNVFGMLCRELDPEQSYSLRTWRWYGTNLTRYGFGGGDNVFYESDPDVYSRWDNYTPALLPSEVGSAFTVDFVAENSVKFQRTDENNEWPWVQGASGGWVQSAVSATDFDGDGHLDYVVSARFPLNTDDHDSIWVFPTSLPYDPEKIEWSGFRNSPAHTGLYAQPVSGQQVLNDAAWEGRITVHSDYVVGHGKTLTIKPGTVVEFASDAALLVQGELLAMGQDNDSIYFKPDGAAPWDKIYLMPGSSSTLSHCVIHGGIEVYANRASAQISQCHIYDMETGLLLYGCQTDNLKCENNLIENCSLYGIDGSLSAGIFSLNTVRLCGRAGIFWVGDYGHTVEAPVFGNNLVTRNGTSSPIAGGYFNSTTAVLNCNHFEYNQPYQIVCENNADVVMNAGYAGGAPNLLRADNTPVSCGGALNYPLMWIYKAMPELVYGHNDFHFDNDGTYIWRNTDTPLLDVKSNHFFPDSTPIGANNHHFCPELGYQGAFGSTDQSCKMPAPSGLEGSSALYQQAAIAEQDSNFATSRSAYAAVIAQYPASEEALWATRSSLRTGLAANQLPSSLHDSLYAVWSNVAMPIDVRHSARREAVWALITGQNYFAARQELQAIMNDPVTADSLWAVITTDMVSLLEDGGTHTGSVPRDMHQRLASFHDRLNRLMGRATDEEVLNSKPATVKSERMCRAYPNPFNNTVNIVFDLQKDTHVRLDVFNLLGQKVATLVNEAMKAGSHTYSWSGKNASSGMYFYRFQAGGHIETQKLMLLK